MDDPVAEIRDVVRGVTEPYEASVIVANVEKYFTPDAFILHPILHLPQSETSRNELAGLYKWLRVFTIDQKIDFHQVMFNEDKTAVTIDMTEHLRLRRNLFSSSDLISPRLLVRLDLRKCPDGKYRIWKQEDVAITSGTTMGIAQIVPLYNAVDHHLKKMTAIITGKTGKFILEKGWFGP